MVVPLPETVVPLHPLLVEPPPHLLKSTRWVRCFLYICLCVQCLTTFALLVSPIPDWAFLNSVCFFTCFFALRGFLPLRYYIHAMVAGYLFFASTARYSARISMPEFGYSVNQQVLNLARFLEQHVASSRFNHDLRGAQSLQYPLGREHSGSLGDLDNNGIVSDGAVSEEAARIALKLPSFIQRQARSEGPQGAQTGTPTNTLPVVSHTSLLSEVRPSQQNELTGGYVPLAQRAGSNGGHALVPPDAPDDASLITQESKIREHPFKGNSEASHRHYVVDDEAINAFMSLRPASWRILVEQIALLLTAITGCISTLLAWYMGGQIQKVVASALQTTLGDQGPAFASSQTQFGFGLHTPEASAAREGTRFPSPLVVTGSNADVPRDPSLTLSGSARPNEALSDSHHATTPATLEASAVSSQGTLGDGSTVRLHDNYHSEPRMASSFEERDATLSSMPSPPAAFVPFTGESLTVGDVQTLRPDGASSSRRDEREKQGASPPTVL